MIINKKEEYGTKMDVLNPYDNSIVGKIFSANPDQVKWAFKNSMTAFKDFRHTKPEDRREMLLQMGEWVNKNTKRLAEILARESGKPVKACASEISSSATRLNVAASEVFLIKGETVRTKGITATVFREPLGPIATIGPFNYPFFSIISKVAPALAAGNTVVAKTASDDPLATMDFVQGVQEILPAGVLNSVSGRGSVVGNAMVTDPHTRMIAFTGSYAVGKWIADNSGFKKIHLELGGKAPAIVMPSADLGRAAKEIVKGAVSLGGQRCNAISIVMAHSEVKRELTELIVKEVKKYKVGDHMKSGTQIGPLINQGAVDRVKGMVDEALSKGAVALNEYKIEKNLFYPVVLDKVNEQMRVAYEETFGPVVPIMQFEDLGWLSEFFSGLNYRLDSSIFTDSVKDALFVMKYLDEGSIHINQAPAHGLGVYPYGEAVDAGMGREGLISTMNEMTTLKTMIWKP